MSWKLYVKKKTCGWKGGPDGQGGKEEGTGIEEAATKRSAEGGGCVFRERYGDSLSSESTGCNIGSREMVLGDVEVL